MIQIKYLQNCCGCTACAEICTHNAISMKADQYGFQYPVIDNSKCIDCGLCEKVCPVLRTDENEAPIKCYAFKHNDESIRKRSSTGGAFVRLSEEILSKGGVIFGAAFDSDWKVRHMYVENAEDLWKLVGSKYLQSYIGNSYKVCKSFLQSGKIVLFSGTPCQIAGLKNYLRKDYENLLCVDLICHGVPAPEIWSQYLNYRVKRKSNEIGKSLRINNVNFRDKTYGWESYSLSLSLSDECGNFYNDSPICWKDDAYMQSFLRHLNLRPICFHCPFRNRRNKSDIMIGDFWKFSESYPDMYNDKIGINAVIVNTEKGMSVMQKVDFDGFETSYGNIVRGNTQLIKSPLPHINRKRFLKYLGKKDFNALVSDCLHLSFGERLLSKIRTFCLLYLK